jgi:poly-gamma-glutamate synthesis protein (capsule biosynthesis protein)
MTGRGIDQILRHPGDPSLHEPHVDNAQVYVRLAEKLHGLIPRRAADEYVWGDALAELARVAPDARIVNLETAITTSDDFEPRKEVHYRMNPANTGCLKAPAIDCCCLANNHVLDWGRAGLLETLDVLAQNRFAVAGAGRNLDQATRPAILGLPAQGRPPQGRPPRGRVLVFACGSQSAGIPGAWAATETDPGVHLIDEYSTEAADKLAAIVRRTKQPGDLALLSIHWGGNWGFSVPRAQRQFAQAAIDRGGIDLVHGHSSHHVRPIEVHNGHLILYGCGDFLNDYEGISGYEQFRGDLGAMYFATLDPETGKLLSLDMTPMQSVRFRLTHPSPQDVQWLQDTFNSIGAALGTSVEKSDRGQLRLRWSRSNA